MYIPTYAIHTKNTLGIQVGSQETTVALERRLRCKAAHVGGLDNVVKELEQIASHRNNTPTQTTLASMSNGWLC
jgi:putative component of membrane protein insertase Oxa1/YidC/SpoIIIJ protein YidD